MPCAKMNFSTCFLYSPKDIFHRLHNNILEHGQKRTFESTIKINSVERIIKEKYKTIISKCVKMICWFISISIQF